MAVKCILIIFLFICGAFAVSVISDNDLPELEWPEKFSINIIKVTLNAGLQEDMEVWQDQSSNRTRVDYNKGAVVRFYFGPTDSSSDDNVTKKEIHPQTENGTMNTMICYTPDDDDDFMDPDAILPNEDGYELIGEEVKNGVNCHKFSDQSEEGTIKTLWASYNTTTKEWIPVKYEALQYVTGLGIMKNHEVWDFENYYNDFDEEEVFNTEEYCGSEAEVIRYKMDDEVITKHLIFMDPENEEHVNHVFEAFKKKYKRNYADKNEHAMRKAIFHRNMRLIVSTNRKNLGYKLSVNHFSDRTHEELNHHMGLKKGPKSAPSDPFPYNESTIIELSSKLPSDYDLRLLGVISPVENQEVCGSCWSFAATAVAEGALARSNGGRLIKLSNQALVDCGWEFGNSGCDGGTDGDSYKMMMKYGLPTEEEYGSYANMVGFCHIKNMIKTYPIKGFVDVTPNSVGALKVALHNHGPVSISINATDAFVQYSQGILYDVTCDENSNHLVTLVGYGESDGETYWILKNSWGPEWGIDGYIHISAKNNNCGVMTEPRYVLF